MLFSAPGLVTVSFFIGALGNDSHFAGRSFDPEAPYAFRGYLPARV
jgi:hypothetical protein